MFRSDLHLQLSASVGGARFVRMKSQLSVYKLRRFLVRSHQEDAARPSHTFGLRTLPDIEKS